MNVIYYYHVPKCGGTFIFENLSELNIDITDQEKMVKKLKDKNLNIEKEQRNVVKHIETNYKDAISKVKDLVDFDSETLEE